jgi:hypothetical protein
MGYKRRRKLSGKRNGARKRDRSIAYGARSIEVSRYEILMYNELRTSLIGLPAYSLLLGTFYLT